MASEDTTPPVVFHFFQGKPDTRLQVFGHEFHVHSYVLRTHSAFFRKFMESDGNTCNSISGHSMANSDFRYEYVGQVDEDGTWGLQPLHMVFHNTLFVDSQLILAHQTAMVQTEKLNDSEKEVKIFEDLLSAFYLKRCAITDLSHLQDLVKIADFYLALPALSNFVESNLLLSPGLIGDIARFSYFTLTLAEKIRAPVLFREAFVHVVGKWNTFGQLERTEFETRASPVLYNLVRIYHGELCEAMAKISNFLVIHCMDSKDPGTMDLQNIIRKQLLARKGNQILRMMNEPNFLHTVLVALRNSGRQTSHYVSPSLVNALKAEAQERLGRLLKRKILLNYTKENGTEMEFNYVLCTEIADSDIPWGSEVDW